MLLVFDYSGQADRPQGLDDNYLFFSQKTACKGEILKCLAPYLKQQSQQCQYIGLIDDDVVISIRQINEALQLASSLGCLSFSPSLHPDDSTFVTHMLSRGNSTARRVDWVELKMSFVRSDLFMATAPFYPLSYSGYGIDCFVHPYFAKVFGLDGEIYVFDHIVVRDFRPHRSGFMRFKNGLTGLEEARRLHKLCLSHLLNERPNLIRDPTIRRVLHLQRLKLLIQDINQIEDYRPELDSEA